MATMKDLEARLEQLAEENALLKRAVLQQESAAPGATRQDEERVVNNGYRPLFNPSRPNPDNRDWQPGTPKKWDADKGYKVGYTTFHAGDGMWEWGYEDPETGEAYFTGKLLGEHPPGPPNLPPKEFFDL
jgi:hypothetical protein